MTRKYKASCHTHSLCFVGCGGVIIRSEGTLTSPNYPISDYPSDALCEWHVSVPSGRMLLNITDLEIEYHSSCDYDYVSVSCYIAMYIIKLENEVITDSDARCYL